MATRLKIGDRIKVNKHSGFSGMCGVIRGCQSRDGDEWNVDLEGYGQAVLYGHKLDLEYPPIGSMWRFTSGSIAMEFRVIGHGKNSRGHPNFRGVQVEVLGTKDREWFFVETFRDTSKMICLDHPAEDYAKPLHGTKLNNDGLDRCRWCGASTKVVGCMPSSDMRICTKCRR